jgi:hypothetical protein
MQEKFVCQKVFTNWLALWDYLHVVIRVHIIMNYSDVQWSCAHCRRAYPLSIERCTNLSCNDGAKRSTAAAAGSAAGWADFTCEQPSKKCITYNAIGSIRDLHATVAAATAAGPKRPRSRIFLSSETDHYSQSGQQDDGHYWTCGYRNIQMLCSALMRDSKYSKVLFGGCNFIPDVAGIQVQFRPGNYISSRYPTRACVQFWIEKAWRAGFDEASAAHFGGVLSGSDERIGAAECCALLRYFGASVVDHTVLCGSLTACSSLYIVQAFQHTLWVCMHWTVRTSGSHMATLLHGQLQTRLPRRRLHCCAALGVRRWSCVRRGRLTSTTDLAPPLAPLPTWWSTSAAARS